MYDFDADADAEFKKVIKSHAEIDSKSFLNNSFAPVHGASVIEEIFNRANGTIYILTDRLNSLIYGRNDVKCAAKKFLQKEGSCIKIILQFNRETERSLSVFGENDFLISLKEYVDKIFLFRSCEKWKSVGSFIMTKTITNKYAFRYQFKNESPHATATFNAGDNGNGFKEIAERMILASKKISLKRFNLIKPLEHEIGEILI